MIGSNRPAAAELRDAGFETPLKQPGLGSRQRMDPLSEVLALMKPQLYVAGGFSVPGDMAIQFPKHPGIKCYAMLAGECWLVGRRRA
jgi:hypothetical protein